MMSQSLFVHEPSELRDLAAIAIERGHALGASDVVARVSEGSNLSVSVRNGELDVMKRSRSKQLSITVYVDGCRGGTTSADLSPDAIAVATKAAFDIASYTAEDPHAGPVETESLVRDPVDPGLLHLWEVSPEEAIALAAEMEAAALAESPLITGGGEPDATNRLGTTSLASNGSSVSADHSQFALATSRGLSVGYAQSFHSLSCSVIAARDGGMQNGSWNSVARAPADLEGTACLGRAAAARALAQLGARRLPTAPAAVMFEAPVAASIVAALLRAASGDAQYKRRSFLLAAVGREVMANHLTIEERPHAAMGLASAPFDGEGVATRTRDIVSNGMLTTYLLDSYAARRLDLPYTGHAGGARNARLVSSRTSDGDDFEAMLRKLDTGLLVTHTMGGGANPMTGDYSQGVAGLWVERGEVRHAAQEITISGNLLEMLAGIVAVGADRFTRGAIETGSILIDRMQIAGA